MPIASTRRLSARRCSATESNIARLIYAATHPEMHPDCCPIEQDAIQAQLEAWYEADGRHDPAHPMHCLYTGLAAKYREQEVGK